MRCLALLFTFVLFPAGSRAADFDPRPIDEVVERAMKEYRVPGAAVVIVRDGEVLYLKGFGIRERGKPEKVTPDTVFPIASCSKAFTTTVLAMLASEGKLTWDDKVRDHLDYFRLSDELADREVTLRDLACHRTGMPRHDMLWSAIGGESRDVIRRWAKARPSSSFRAKWEYSNVPFTTAGVIAGKLGNTDWAGIVSERILKPLAMNRSSCTWQEGFAQADHATPHYYGFDKSITPVKWDEIDHAGGAGCVNSCARDLAAWLQFLLAGGKYDGKRLLTERALRETWRAQMLVNPEGPFVYYFPAHVTRFVSYGLGWFVHDYRGFNCVSHGGTLTGFRAQCMLVPEKNIGVFVLCNLRPSFLCEAVAKTALDQLLELPTEDWVAVHKVYLAAADANIAAQKKQREANRKLDTRPSLELASYAGGYTEPAYGRAEVIAEGTRLRISWGKLVFRLEHYHFDTFTAIPVEPKDEIISYDRSLFDVQFRLGTTGEVEGMRFLDQEFRRAKK